MPIDRQTRMNHNRMHHATGGMTTVCNVMMQFDKTRFWKSDADWLVIGCIDAVEEIPRGSAIYLDNFIKREG